MEYDKQIKQQSYRFIKPQGGTMIYYNDNEVMIRDMEEADAQVFTNEEIAQGWNSDISKYLARLKDRAEGKCISLTAEYKGYQAGYVNVYITGLGGRV